MAAPPVTVAIVSWNTRELLARCLRSLAEDAERGLAEVWVVDNASSDGSADLVRDAFGWVRLVASPENLGFGRAVNLVARRTTSEWLAAANADVALRPGALAELVRTGRRDPCAAAVAPRLVLPDGETQHSVFALPTLPFTAAFASGLLGLSATLADRRALVGAWDPGRARRVPWAIAAFLLLRRTAWDEVGGFDERQWMYAEDLDLGWRLHDAGWVTRYEPRAVADHESAASTSQRFGPDPAPHWQRSTYGCIAQRRGARYARAVAALNVAGALGRWLATAMRAARRPELAARRDAHRRWLGIHLAGLRRPAAHDAPR